MNITVRPLTGDELADALNPLAQLRIAVFADWPYLYDGDAGYEAAYMREFSAAPDAVLVAAFDGDAIVGAATAAPMVHQKAEFRDPFAARGIDVARLFYFGESVLLPRYRGHGIGHAFFDHREAQARACGRQRIVFCRGHPSGRPSCAACGLCSARSVLDPPRLCGSARSGDRTGLERPRAMPRKR